jgi:hypothetical protein
MRKSVKLAPTSIPPTAIGRTTKRHRCPAMAAQPIVPSAAVYAGASCGPRKKTRSGTKRPHDIRPPAKFSEPSSGPMM